MQEIDFFDGFENKYPYRNSRPMSLEKLIDSILELEKNGVITFDEFKKLGYMRIQQEYFGMIHSTQMTKAIIKIEDSRQGKTTPSSITTVTEIYKDGKVVKVKQNTSFF